LRLATGQVDIILARRFSRPAPASISVAGILTIDILLIAIGREVLHRRLRQGITGQSAILRTTILRQGIGRGLAARRLQQSRDIEAF